MDPPPRWCRSPTTRDATNTTATMAYLADSFGSASATAPVPGPSSIPFTPSDQGSVATDNVKRKRKRPQSPPPHRSPSTSDLPIDPRSNPSDSSVKGPTTQTPAERSCAECRRLKLKCSRTWPCTSCVKRNCPALCPNGVMKKDPIDQFSLLHYSDLLFKYIAHLQDELRNNGIPLPASHSDTPTTVPDFLEKCTAPGDTAGQIQHPAMDVKGRLPNKNPSSSDTTENSSSLPRLEKIKTERPHDSSGSLTPRAHSLDTTANPASFTPDDLALMDAYAIPHPPTAPPPRPDSSEKGSAPSSKTRQGFGTLAISESGSAKYIGPSAGSEWLNCLEDEGWSARTASNRPASHQGTSPASRLLDDGASVSSASSCRRSHRMDRNTLSQRQSFALPLIIGAQFSPMTATQKMQILDKLANQLPSRREALDLVRWYFRHSSWQFRLVERPKVNSILDLIYSSLARPEHAVPPSDIAHLYGGTAMATAAASPKTRHGTRHFKGEELALLFTVLALGAWFDLTVPLHEAAKSAMKWFQAGQTAFATSNCLSSNSVLSVQVLHLTAVYLLQTQHVNGGDLAWPLLGLALRMTQTMGMHIDGEAWDLDPEQLNERRRQWWEIYCHDTFQAICFGRPGNLSSHEYNCKFPLEEEAQSPEYGDDEDMQGTDDAYGRSLPRHAGYNTLLFRLTRIARRMLSEAFSVRAPRYREILSFDLELRKFEDHIPFFIRCRPSCAAPCIVPPAPTVATSTQWRESPSTTSSGSTFRGASRASSVSGGPVPGPGPSLTPLNAPGGKSERRPSPDVRPDRVRLTLQAHDLATCVAQLHMFLHRKPFAEAILLDPITPSKTPYGYSFLAAIDSAVQMIAVVDSLFRLYPNLIVRIWSFWYHTFSAGVLCAFCCLHAPLSDRTSLAYDEVKKACKLLEDAKGGPRSEDGLRTLLRLKERAEEAMREARIKQHQQQQQQQQQAAKSRGKGRSSEASSLSRSRSDGRGPGKKQAGNGADSKESYTSEDHEAAQAMMGISTRLLRCSEGPFTRDNSPDGDESEDEDGVGRYDEADADGVPSHSYATPALTQQDLDSILPSNHKTVHTLTHLQPLAEGRMGTQPMSTGFGQHDAEGLFPDAMIPGGNGPTPSGYPFIDEHHSTLAGWPSGGGNGGNGNGMGYGSGASVGGHASTPRTRHELQTDLERLLTMDDLWFSFGAGGNSNPNPTGAAAGPGPGAEAPAPDSNSTSNAQRFQQHQQHQHQHHPAFDQQTAGNNGPVAGAGAASTPGSSMAWSELQGDLANVFPMPHGGGGGGHGHDGGQW